MRSAADEFCDHLREGLKEQLQLGQMKRIKSFSKTLYSEALIAPEASEGGKSPVIDANGKADGEELVEEGEYLRGLGFEFKFPGDPKK